MRAMNQEEQEGREKKMDFRFFIFFSLTYVQ